jgi:hypothetical protein
MVVVQSRPKKCSLPPSMTVLSSAQAGKIGGQNRRCNAVLGWSCKGQKGVLQLSRLHFQQRGWHLPPPTVRIRRHPLCPTTHAEVQFSCEVDSPIPAGPVWTRNVSGFAYSVTEIATRAKSRRNWCHATG